MRLKEACKEKGITMKELSNRTGYSVVTIYRWDKRLRSPNSEAIRVLCEALDMSADDLLELLPNPTPTTRNQTTAN